jgi:hypothetical protein
MFLPHCLAADRHGHGGTRLTLTPSVIPNSNYVFMVSDWNFLKYRVNKKDERNFVRRMLQNWVNLFESHCIFVCFCTIIITCIGTCRSPCIFVIFVSLIKLTNEISTAAFAAQSQRNIQMPVIELSNLFVLQTHFFICTAIYKQKCRPVWGWCHIWCINTSLRSLPPNADLAQVRISSDGGLTFFKRSA